MRARFGIVLLLGIALHVPSVWSGLETQDPREKCVALFRARVRAITPTLPSVAGAQDNIPKSLRKVPQNRILFGIEAEYSADANYLGSESVSTETAGVQDLFKFYSGGIESLESSELPLRNPSELAALPPDDRWIADYLPPATQKEQGKQATHEIATGVLPNLRTFSRILDEIDTRVGRGSYQGMISIPYAAAVRMGQTEISGFIHLTNELSTLSAIARPRKFHPLLHPYNVPYQNERNSLVLTLRRELSEFFKTHAFESSVSPKTMNNPKYTLGIAPRFDMSSQLGGARLFFEIRGCKENPQCVKNLIAQANHVFEKEIHGFSSFSELDSLHEEVPWKLIDEWTALPETERQSIQGSMRRALKYFTRGSIDIQNNFLYPLKDWGRIARALDLNASQAERLQAAQINYMKMLQSDEWRSETETGAIAKLVAHLGPALETFVRDGGLLAHLQTRWKTITGREWNVEF